MASKQHERVTTGFGPECKFIFLSVLVLFIYYNLSVNTANTTRSYSCNQGAFLTDSSC
jgi:hypothetical protein